jgi:hypothetical protein
LARRIASSPAYRTEHWWHWRKWWSEKSINRVYRTNIEKAGRNIEWKLAECYVAERLDRLFRPLRTQHAFNAGNIEHVCDAHEGVVHVTKKATKRLDNSFCAKYLSLHFRRVVPIYDGFAYRTAWNLVGRELRTLDFDSHLNADYRYHCAAVLRLCSVLAENGVRKPNIKILDQVLYRASR